MASKKTSTARKSSAGKSPATQTGARKSSAKKQAPSKSASKKSSAASTRGSKKSSSAKKPAKRASGKRELIDTGTDKRYVRRDSAGQFRDSVDVGRSLSADKRSQSSKKVKSGYGDRGDR